MTPRLYAISQRKASGPGGGAIPVNTYQPPDTNPITLATLAALRVWVAWRLEARTPGGKKTKVPYVGTQAKAQAGGGPWLTRSKAESAAWVLLLAGGEGGIGIEFTTLPCGRALGGIDLDACRDPVTGEIAPWASEVIATFASYAEVSPSKTGVKVFFSYDPADAPAIRKSMGTPHGRTFKRPGDAGDGHSPAIELHVSNRYFTVTEAKLDGSPDVFRMVPLADLLHLIEVTGPAFAGIQTGGDPPHPPGPNRHPDTDNDPGPCGAANEPSDAARRRIAWSVAGGDFLRALWDKDWSGQSDRSARAFSLGVGLKGAGLAYPDMVRALLDHPATAAWAAEKGVADQERELRRIWENARASAPLHHCAVIGLSRLSAADYQAQREQAAGDLGLSLPALDVRVGHARTGDRGSPGGASGSPGGETDAIAIARLAALSEMEYSRVRATEAKRMGVPVGVLDRQVNAARKASAGASASAATARRHAPWPEPVALADVLDRLAAALGKHMILPDGAAEAIALWVAHTWVYDRFERTPRLAITSATKRCGKSTLMEILQATSRGAIRADSLTASSVFRVVSALSPLSLVIDEADTFMGENEELRGVLNSGFAFDGQVLRTVEVEGRHEVQAFATFAPVALAAIKSIPGTISDRAIPVRLQRKSKAETITLLRTEGSRPALADLARQLARWAADDGERLNLNPTVPAPLGDREGDISVPLLAISDQAGPGWATRGRSSLLGLFGLRAADDSAEEVGIMLLTDIRQIFVGKAATRRSSKELCDDLATYDERPWPELRNGKPITEPQLARVLRPFGIRPGVIRDGDATPRGYLKKAFEDAWARYLPDTDPLPKPDPIPDPAEDEIVI